MISPIKISSTDEIRSRITELTGWKVDPKPRIITDTSDPMNIYRGHIVKLNARHFLIKGHMREPRFGIDDQMKYWVFKAIELETGVEKILKTPFLEDFHAHIGLLKIHCYRSPEKESEVLDKTSGNLDYMQGYTAFDDVGNNVRVIEFIRGKTFFHYIPAFAKDHETYFYEDFPVILRKLSTAINAIAHLHDIGFCHGDIRNDHIIIDSRTDRYRWIDFDLKQDIKDFDLWSIGNVLNYAVSRGILTFAAVLKGREHSDKVKLSLTGEDASAFYEYRIMNVGKIYPYIPFRLQRIMQNFTVKPLRFYKDIKEFLDEFNEMLDVDFPIKCLDNE